jgi:hypothetical protein
VRGSEEEVDKKEEYDKKRRIGDGERQQVLSTFRADILLGLFHPDNGGDIILRKVGCLTTLRFISKDIKN